MTPGAPDRSEVVVQRPRWTALGIVITIGAAVVVLSTVGRPDTVPDPTTTTEGPTSTTTEVTTAPSLPEVTNAAPASFRFTPSDLEITGTIVSRSRPGFLDFWTVDLAAGSATSLDASAVDGLEPHTTTPEVRLFGQHRAILRLADNRLALLVVGENAVSIEREIDLGARTLIGLDFVTDDGQSVWIRSNSGFLRWQLSDETAIGRWFDLDGDIVDTPEPIAILNDDDLLVAAGGALFQIDDDNVTELRSLGRPIAASGSWILSTDCDDNLRCGLLTARDSLGSIDVDLDPLARHRARCGSLTTEDDRLLVAAQQGAEVTLVEVQSGAVQSETPLYPSMWGCLDVHALSATVRVVSSRRGVALVVDGQVSDIGLEPMGGIVATGW